MAVDGVDGRFVIWLKTSHKNLAVLGFQALHTHSILKDKIKSPENYLHFEIISTQSAVQVIISPVYDEVRFE